MGIEDLKSVEISLNKTKPDMHGGYCIICECGNELPIQRERFLMCYECGNEYFREVKESFFKIERSE